jgi:hypothetical protein
MQQTQERKTTLSATPVQTPETMAAQVRVQLERVYTRGLPAEIDLEHIVRAAVDRFRDVRVKTFVPVLAFRDAREAVAKAAA